MDKDARKAWHGAGADLQFEPGDFEVLDLVLGQIPELRICAYALKRARAVNLTFPITTTESLSALFEGKRFDGGGHRFGPGDASRFMPADFFPIGDEGELVSRIYIALVRCKHEEMSRIHDSETVLPTQHGSLPRKVTS